MSVMLNLTLAVCFIVVVVICGVVSRLEETPKRNSFDPCVAGVKFSERRTFKLFVPVGASYGLTTLIASEWSFVNAIYHFRVTIFEWWMQWLLLMWLGNCEKIWLCLDCLLLCISVVFEFLCASYCLAFGHMQVIRCGQRNETCPDKTFFKLLSVKVILTNSQFTVYIY